MSVLELVVVQVVVVELQVKYVEVLDIEVEYVEVSSCRSHDEGVGGRW